MADSVIQRVFALFACFSAEQSRQSLATLVEKTGLPKSTAHRLATRLVELGALERIGDGYQIGMRMFEIGELTAHRALRSAALPFIEDLFEATHETVQLAVLDDLDVVYVEKIVGHRGVKAPSRVGGRMDSHCTAVGKVLLSFGPEEVIERVIERGLPAVSDRTITDPRRFRQELERVRRDRIAIDGEETRPGVGCVAAPVFDRTTRAVAALSVMAPTGRFQPRRFAPAVQTAALSLSRVLRKDPSLMAP